MSTQHPTGSEFKTTQWSMVLSAPDDAASLERLVTTYWGPIYAFIRRSGNPPEQAADLTQEFIAKLLAERSVIERADPHRGRFRTFLKSTLRNFLIDRHRRSTTLARSPARALLALPALGDYEPAADEDPSAAFDRQWVATLIMLAVERVSADCEKAGQVVHWAVFNAAVLEPGRAQQPPPTLETLARAHGLESAEKVASMVQTVRRKFRRTLHEVVLATIADPQEASDEIFRLRGLLKL